MAQKELIVLLLSAVPVIEVRGAVPLGIAWGLAPLNVYLLAVIGSLLPVIPIFIGLKYFTESLRKIDVFDRFFGWLFARTRNRGKIVEDLETLGLMIFVSIPLPGTGVWTGCLAAHLFGISFPKTVIACIAGTSAASLIMLLGSMGVISAF